MPSIIRLSGLRRGPRVLILVVTLLSTASVPCAAQAPPGFEPLVESPDGRVVLHYALGDFGEPRYAVTLEGRTLVGSSPLGLVTTVGHWDTGVEEVDRTEVEADVGQYRLLHGKCGTCAYEAVRRTVRLSDPEGRDLEIVFRVSDDGVAFRYRIPGDEPVVTAREELTGFAFGSDARTWLMPMDDPESGWMRVNPAYEAHYIMDGAVGEPSPTGVGWALPGLFHSPEAGWALVTEAGMDGSYVASRLRAESDGLYRIAWPEPGEGTGPGDPVEPSFALPFASPWRVIVVGTDPGPIVESSLVTDVSAPSVLGEPAFVRPGKAAWSWLPLKDESIVPEVQRDFIDMAAAQGYAYVLVDNWWDRNIGYDGIAQLVDYAAERDVGIIVWYNTNGNYNDAPQTPQDRLVDPDVRRQEFARLRELGVRGIKADFFGGDKQSVIRHYLEILEDAAEYELLVNFHGATLPRGWSRTYPNFMTAEAVMGYEFITFGQADADLGPSHAAMLPFARNAVGPMDFTPTMFSDRVGASIRRTSDAFDVAMNVVFESGIQHLGVTPESLRRVPDYVREYLSEVPVAWDETRFVEGNPGEYIVLARRKGDHWYVGGINGTESPRAVEVDLGFVGIVEEGTLLTDGADDRSVQRSPIEASSTRFRVEMPGHGGFAAVVATGG